MSTLELLAACKRHRVLPRLVEGVLLLEGDTDNLPQELLERIRAGRKGLIDLLQSVSDTPAGIVIPPAPVAAHYPLSEVQQRLWVVCQQPGAAAAYHISTRLLLQGPIDETLLAASWQMVVDRHESLRTVIQLIEGEPRQVIRERVYLNLEREDLSTATDHRQVLIDKITCLSQQPFDLEQGPLLRVHLFQLSAGSYALLVVVHHIISDGSTVLNLLTDVLACYAARTNNTALPAAPGFHFKDYVAWKPAQPATVTDREAATFWSGYLASPVAPLQLPTDQPRPENKRYRGAIAKYYLPAATSSRITAFCTARQVTLFHFFRALLSLGLGKLSGQSMLRLGTAVSLRNHTSLEDQLGLYIDTLPLQANISWDASFHTFAQEMAADTRQAIAYRHYPFDKILEQAREETGPGRNPLFDVMLSVQEMGLPERVTGLQISPLDHYLATDGQVHFDGMAAKFDLSFQAGIEAGTGMFVEIEYATDIFTRYSAGQLWAFLHHVLHQVLDQPEQPLHTLEWVTPGDKQKQLVTFNDTARDFPATMTITRLWQQQAGRTPHEVALLAGDRQWTYRELDNLSCRLAGWLQQVHAVRRHDRVAIQLERSEWMLVSILAIIRTGAAYVPIDPLFPLERTTYILENSNSKVLIDESVLRQCFDAEQVWMDPEDLPAGEPDDLLYIIYTSGSTGRPKGCELEHRGIVNRLHWMWHHYGFRASDIFLQKTNYTFDVSVWEIFMPLINGARLVLCEAGRAGDPAHIAALIARHGITCLHFVPGMLQTFLAHLLDNRQLLPTLNSLQSVMASGEALLSETVSQWYSCLPASLHNLYGPTEASVDVTHYTTRPGDRSIPIGQPIWNTRMYILDEQHALLPTGVTGELCIGGVGLARGYAQAPALTAATFIADPFLPGQRIYKTGDLGRWTKDGLIEYLGRKDQQVKVRGYRIEPGEIESILLQGPGVQEAIVVAQQQADASNELIAYLIGTALPPEEELRSFLLRHLPSYMIPAYIVTMEAFPLTVSGKIDRARLPDPVKRTAARECADKVPSDPLQAQLRILWQEVLNKEDIGIHEDFYRLGGHSLKAARLLTRICKQLGVQLTLQQLLSTTTIEAQARLLAQATKRGFTPIPVTAVQAGYPLSQSQRRLWALSQLEEVRQAYNMPGAYQFTGQLQPALLKQAFEALLVRHESLRTIFIERESGLPVQVVLPVSDTGFVLQQTDLRSAADPRQQLHASLADAFSQPFQLDKGPLLRVALFRIDDDSWVCGYVMHHLISDGWSLGILWQELLQVYTSLVNQETVALPPLPIQFRDYVAWFQDRYTQPVKEQHLHYWLQTLQGELPVTELPAYRQRPAIKTYRGSIVRDLLPASLAQPFKTLLQEEGATLFTGLLSLVNVLIYRYTFQTDQLIGTPVSGRDHADLEQQVGFYTNTLALRIKGDQADPFSGWLKKVAAVVTAALQHQHLPLDELVEALALPHDRSRHPLFDIEVILQQQEAGSLAAIQELPGVQVKPYEALTYATARFDLVFEFIEAGEEIGLQLVYNTDLYSEAEAAQWLRHLVQLTRAVIDAPGCPIHALNYLTPAELQQLLTGLNNSAVDYPAAQTIVSLFDQQCDRTPDATALVWAGKRLTYRQLDEKANQLAHYLLTEQAVQPDEMIGILLDRTDKLIIAILGIVKAGAAYVPIDTAFPAGRKAFICTDTQLRILLTQTDYLFDLDFFDGHIFALDVQADSLGTPRTRTGVIPHRHHLAYVIYTSGSTGTPKGVMIEHGTIANTIQSQITLFGASAGEHHLQFASCSFDASVSEIFVALCSGAVLYLIDEAERKDTIRLTHFLQQHRIDLATIPPAYLKWLDIAQLGSLRKLVTAGEAAIADKVAAYQQMGHYFNAYGPTETSICATIFSVPAGSGILADQVPIGTPIANTQVYLLDPHQQPTPFGVPGELYIGGAGLARGYLNQPALTAARFIPHPFIPGQRLYRTGDLARWLPEGQLAFIGRTDNQVKIRGYRIELDEIAQALQGHPVIEAAAVIVRTLPDGDKEIIAYIAGPAVNTLGDLNTWLAQYLPPYMLPAAYVPLGTLPLTTAGKLDRRALPAPEKATTVDGGSYEAPRDLVERELATIWQEILGKERIGIRDDFFELGGHSLRATRLVSMVHKQFQVKIDLRDIFATTRLEDQASLIRAARQSVFQPITPVPPASSYTLSSSQKRVWLHSQSGDHSQLYHVPAAFVLTGTLDLPGLQGAFRQLTSRHEMLRTVFGEPEPGQPRQIVLTPEAFSFRVDYNDLRDDPDKAMLAQQLVQRDYYQPFDLASGPLLRAGLYQLQDDQWIFTFTMHHIISDGWSMEVFIRELLHYYRACAAQTAAALPALTVQYKDYAAWQQQQLPEATLQAQRDWWLQQLVAPLPVLRLPGNRPVLKTYRGDTVQSRIDASLYQALNERLLHSGATLFMGLLAAVNILLYHRTKQDDFIIGTPVAGREHSDLDGQIGFYINTLPLRIKPDPEKSYADLLSTVKTVTLGAYTNQAYPFDELITALPLVHDASRNLLFDVWIVLHNVGVRTLQSDHHLPGLTMQPYAGAPAPLTKCDLQFNFEVSGDTLLTDIEYNIDIISRQEASILAQELEHILRLVVQDSAATPVSISRWLSQWGQQQQEQAAQQRRQKNLAGLKQQS